MVSTMKRRTEFNIVASIILAICLVSWFFTQRCYIGPVEQAAIMSILNIIVYGLALFVVLLIIASYYR